MDDGRLDPDRVDEELTRLSNDRLWDNHEMLRLWNMACDLNVEVKRLRDKIEEIHTYIPAREE